MPSCKQNSHYCMKVRQQNGHLIFMIRIPIPLKVVFILKQDQWSCHYFFGMPCCVGFIPPWVTGLSTHVAAPSPLRNSHHSPTCHHNCADFLQILTIDTPQLARMGKLWGACCEFLENISLKEHVLGFLLWVFGEYQPERARKTFVIHVICLMGFICSI